MLPDSLTLGRDGSTTCPATSRLLEAPRGSENRAALPTAHDGVAHWPTAFLLLTVSNPGPRIRLYISHRRLYQSTTAQRDEQ
jgi:hypothetical protein